MILIKSRIMDENRGFLYTKLYRVISKPLWNVLLVSLWIYCENRMFVEYSYTCTAVGGWIKAMMGEDPWNL